MRIISFISQNNKSIQNTFRFIKSKGFITLSLSVSLSVTLWGGNVIYSAAILDRMLIFLVDTTYQIQHYFLLFLYSFLELYEATYECFYSV